MLPALAALVPEIIKEGYKFITGQKEQKEYAENVTSLAENKSNEFTERQKIDMQSDSWWSKNIRPLSLVYLLVLLTVICICDMSGIKLAAELVALVISLLKIAIGFYFSWRGGEKITDKIMNFFTSKKG